MWTIPRAKSGCVQSLARNTGGRNWRSNGDPPSLSLCSLLGPALSTRQDLSLFFREYNYVHARVTQRRSDVFAMAPFAMWKELHTFVAAVPLVQGCRASSQLLAALPWNTREIPSLIFRPPDSHDGFILRRQMTRSDLP